MEKEKMIATVQENIAKIESKDFNVYFFVLDTKGKPSGNLEYIYGTALTLKRMGYKVTMLHNEKEFIGVGDWLSGEAAELPHVNIEKNNVDVSPCDFLFIPELFANVMLKTKELPCKKVMILQSLDFLLDFMPVGATPEMLNITDIICPTNALCERVKTYFPRVKTHLVRPVISDLFHKDDKAKKLIVNIVADDQSDVDKIIKPFYWKYPVYKWISFRDLRGVSQEVFADALRESAFTIWMDDGSDMGRVPLEAMRCGNVVIAKVPDRPSDWMVDADGNMGNNCFWFFDSESVPDFLANLVNKWLLDEIPEDVYVAASKLDNAYNQDEQDMDITKEYVELFEKRAQDFKAVLSELSK